MGSVVQAVCPCGYQERFTIGGSRHSFQTHSYFPYRCTSCGIVSVNIAEEPARCPNDAGHTVLRIGGRFAARMGLEKEGGGEDNEKAPMRPRKQTFLEWLGLRKTPPLPAVLPPSPPPSPTQLIEAGAKPRVRCQWGDHEIYDEAYECPKCGEVILRFTRTLLRFD